jgi:hypothetical protein
MLITHARQLGFSIAHGFVTSDDGIDSYFTFGLQLPDTDTCVSQLACILFSFELSFGVLARGAIAFAREALGLLRQAFERRFKLPGNLANSLSDGRLREQIGA